MFLALCPSPMALDVDLYSLIRSKIVHLFTFPLKIRSRRRKVPCLLRASRRSSKFQKNPFHIWPMQEITKSTQKETKVSTSLAAKAYKCSEGPKRDSLSIPDAGKAPWPQLWLTIIQTPNFPLRSSSWETSVAVSVPHP